MDLVIFTAPTGLVTSILIPGVLNQYTDLTIYGTDLAHVINTTEDQGVIFDTWHWNSTTSAWGIHIAKPSEFYIWDTITYDWIYISPTPTVVITSTSGLMYIDLNWIITEAFWTDVTFTSNIYYNLIDDFSTATPLFSGTATVYRHENIDYLSYYYWVEISWTGPGANVPTGIGPISPIQNITMGDIISVIPKTTGLNDQAITSWQAINNSTNSTLIGQLPFIELSPWNKQRTSGNSIRGSKRINYATPYIANQIAGHWNTTSSNVSLFLSSSDDSFKYTVLFGVETLTSDTNCFVGLSSSLVAPTNVNPNTLTNVIGIAILAGSTNWWIVSGGSSVQTPVDTGIPVNTNDLLRMEIYQLVGLPLWNLRISGPNLLTYEYNDCISSWGTTCPAITTPLGHRAWISNNTIASSASISISSVYTQEVR